MFIGGGVGGRVERARGGGRLLRRLWRGGDRPGRPRLLPLRTDRRGHRRCLRAGLPSATATIAPRASRSSQRSGVPRDVHRHGSRTRLCRSSQSRTRAEQAPSDHRSVRLTWATDHGAALPSVARGGWSSWADGAEVVACAAEVLPPSRSARCSPSQHRLPPRSRSTSNWCSPSISPGRWTMTSSSSSATAMSTALRHPEVIAGDPVGSARADRHHLCRMGGPVPPGHGRAVDDRVGRGRGGGLRRAGRGSAAASASAARRSREGLDFSVAPVRVERRRAARGGPSTSPATAPTTWACRSCRCATASSPRASPSTACRSC